MVGTSEIAKPAALTRPMSRFRKFALFTLLATARADPYKPIVDPTRDDHELFTLLSSDFAELCPESVRLDFDRVAETLRDEL